MTTRFEEWEAERMQDPKFVAALEKQYPKSERDEAQARITVLEEENERLRSDNQELEATLLDAISASLQSLRYETVMRRALGAAPQSVPPTTSQMTIEDWWFWRAYGDWYFGQRQAALKEER